MIQVFTIGEMTAVWNLDDALFLRNHFRIIGSFVSESLGRMCASIGNIDDESTSEKTYNSINVVLPLLLSQIEYEFLRGKGRRNDAVNNNSVGIVNRSCSQMQQCPTLSDFDKYYDMVDQKIIEDREEKNIIRVEERKKRGLGTIQKKDDTQVSINDEWIQSTISSRFPWTSYHCISVPLGLKDRNRLMVFSDLWNRGYTLTTGLKFGGDFLVYCNDPSLEHSKYIAFVLDDSEQLMDLRTIIAQVRLSTYVSKQFLICCPKGNEVDYTILHWSGV